MDVYFFFGQEELQHTAREAGQEWIFSGGGRDAEQVLHLKNVSRISESRNT
jgi:hypothetical protein